MQHFSKLLQIKIKEGRVKIVSPRPIAVHEKIVSPHGRSIKTASGPNATRRRSRDESRLVKALSAQGSSRMQSY